jgi:exopolysaccharide biosynthesis polyprenyl glycosylphosphotransferase
LEGLVTTHVDLSHAGDQNLGSYQSHGVTVVTTPQSGRAISTAIARRGRSMRKQRVITADFVVASTAAVVAARLWAGSSATALHQHRWIFVGALLALPLVLANCGLYRAGLLARRANELRRLTSAVAVWFVGLVLVVHLTATPPANGLLLVVAPAVLVALAVERELVRRVFERRRASGHIVRRALVVGDRSSVADIAMSFEVEPRGYAILGAVMVDPDSDRTAVAGLPIVSYVDNLSEAIDDLDIDTVVIATTGVDAAFTTRLMRRLADTGVHIELSFAVRDVAHDRLVVTERGRLAVAHVLPPIRDGWRAVAKRSFDVIAALGAMIVAAPFLALVAIAIKLDSPGPVFFRQQRVGRNGQPFAMLKLRSMVSNAEELKAELASRNEAAGPLFKMLDDPRITRIGRRLRTTSLDELPQLWNVLRGDMSLVGPRPALPDEISAWTPDLHHRLRVRPGLTGLWQISGRSDASFESYEHLDLYYTDNWSLARDLWIIARTIPAVIAQRGAH